MTLMAKISKTDRNKTHKSNRVLKRSAFSIFLLMCLSVCLPAYAQSPQAKLTATQSGPYYAGVPIELQIVVTGVEKSPEPTLTFRQPKQATLKLVSISPKTSSSIQIINGRMTQSSSVEFVYHLRLLAARPGNYSIGPFSLEQDGNKVSVAGVRVPIEKIASAGNQRVILNLPHDNLIVGQRVPVKLEWWVEEASIEKLSNQQAQIPLFDMTDDFQFYPINDPKADNRFTVLTTNGAEVFPASVHKARWNGKTYAIFTIQQLMIPLRSGSFTIEPSVVTVDEGLRWRRTFFGERTATQVRKQRVSDSRRNITVGALPAQGRPNSFAGAVGKGFSIDVAAERSVVQVGDPINITLTLRGDAQVSAASLPMLSVSFPSRDFRVPNEKIAGVYSESDGTKTFEATIRVLNDSIREIPPIAFSWYDPELKQYQTTESRPVALSVKSAKVVSAADVVSAAPKDQEKTESVNNASRASAASDTQKPRFILSGADLAIETDLNKLTASSDIGVGGLPIQLGSYIIGMLAIIVALISRRGASVAPELKQRSKELSTQREVIAKAEKLQALSAALRRMGALATSLPRSEYEGLLSVCDDRLFAPGGQTANVDSDLRQQALDIADKIITGAKS